jgi:hypothetical protein
VEDSSEDDNKFSVLQGIFRVAERLTASEDGLSTMEVVYLFHYYNLLL